MNKEEAIIKIIRHLIGIVKILAVYFSVTAVFPRLFPELDKHQVPNQRFIGMTDNPMTNAVRAMLSSKSDTPKTMK